MIELFKPESRTVTALQLAKSAKGEVFAEALQKVAEQKAQVQNLLAIGVSKEKALATQEKESADLIELINSNKLDYQLLFDLSDYVLIVAIEEANLEASE